MIPEPADTQEIGPGRLAGKWAGFPIVLTAYQRAWIDEQIREHERACRERLLGPAAALPWQVRMAISPLTVARIGRAFGVPPRLLGDRPLRRARRRRAAAMRAWSRRGRRCR